LTDRCDGPPISARRQEGSGSLTPSLRPLNANPCTGVRGLAGVGRELPTIEEVFKNLDDGAACPAAALGFPAYCQLVPRGHAIAGARERL
jgi:hypothetical protein